MNKIMFQEFNKIPRLTRDCIITEKIDGTNAQVLIINANELKHILLTDNNFNRPRFLEFFDRYVLAKKEGFLMLAGSRRRWLSIQEDNYGFAKWVKRNNEELFKLGEGRHYGEWYGKGIQRNYGLNEKRFALFNVGKWVKINPDLEVLPPDDKRTECPNCCEVVPILYQGMFNTLRIEIALNTLAFNGSSAVKDFMKPEGVVIYHTASGKLFKKTIEGDEKPKGK